VENLPPGTERKGRTGMEIWEKEKDIREVAD
jgi:hypothetical protein